MKNVNNESLEAVHTHTHTHTHTRNLVKREKYNNCKNQAPMLYGSIFGIENQNIKKQSAITLIALIITIIILLILAGVTISTLTRENGILSMSKKASEEYSIAQAKEKLELAIAELRVIQESRNEQLTKESLTQLDNDEISVGSVENFPVEIIMERKYKFNVDENYVVTYVGEADGTIITYTTEPVGYTNGDEIKILLKATNPKGIKEIIDLSDLTGDSIVTTVDNKTEVAIDYKVTKNGTYSFKVIDNENKETVKDVVIDKFDRVEPLDFTPITSNVKADGFTISVECFDGEATEDSIKSGIERYEYYVGTNKYESTETEYKVTGLKKDVTYTIYVIAYDRAGNQKTSITITETPKLKITFSQISQYPYDGRGATLGIDIYGNLWTWGTNQYGELGDGTNTNSSVPIQIKEDTKFSYISSGGYISAAIDVNGNLYVWGYNDYGQIGDGTTENKNTPQLVDIGVKIIKVDVSGIQHILALDENGDIWSWGRDVSGALGLGGIGNQYRPVKMNFENVKFKDILTSAYSSYVIDTDGNLWTWGDNMSGQLGNGTKTNSYTPIKLTTINNVKEVRNNSDGYLTECFAINTSNNIYNWGHNYTSIPVLKTSVKFKTISIKFGIDESGNLYYIEGKNCNKISSDINFVSVTCNKAIDDNGQLYELTSTSYNKIY